MEKYITHNELETRQIGEALAKKLKSGSVVALFGDLGSGKTVLAKGIAKGLGIDEIILSPTFTILRQYEGLNHFDVYRIGDLDELIEIGFEELISGEAISVIEWAEKIEELLPEDAVMIRFSRGIDDNSREIMIDIKEEK